MRAMSDLADLVLALRRVKRGLVVALTGSVAAGKTTLAEALTATLRETSGIAAEVVSTDGFLKASSALDAAGLTLRKGFPETYDHAAMDRSLRAVRRGPTVFPGYSHVTYDADPALARVVRLPDVLIVEGLGFTATTPVDARIYLDAEEADLETWYVRRFIQFWAAGRDDASSFYSRFRTLDREGADRLARTVWAQINLPNLRAHILPLRDSSDIVVRKDLDHTITAINSSRSRKRGGPRPAGEPKPGPGGSSAYP
jgi:type I pantothenate kinase